MKKFLISIVAALFALPLAVQAQTVTNSALAGVSFFTSVPATVTATQGPVKLPNFSGVGTLNVTESGITGSPSGCSVKLFYSQNNATTLTSAVVTQSFTPSTGIQQFAVAPSVTTGDAYTATYACSSTYPTAGLISVSFSPATVTSASASGSQAVTVTSGTLTAVTSITNPVTAQFAATALDPCQNPNVAKSSVAISVSSATTTSLVAVSGSTKVYVCGFVVNAVGTAPTALFEYGTSTNCTGTSALTGAMEPSATVGTITMGFGGTLFTAPASNGVCLVSGGTVTTETGVLTYVQQ